MSGELGTKLKSRILGSYYPFWWNIVSGGEGKNHNVPPSIIELNAGTGEVFIKDSEEILLGSAGHAIQLKMQDWYKKRELTLVLIEEDPECFSHLNNVIKRRWPNIANRKDCLLLNTSIDIALDVLESIDLSMALYFFDPLLFSTWEVIEKVASSRIKTPFKTGTEFIIFIFTSDWFLGRGDFAPLPTNLDRQKWDKTQKETVNKCDQLFGNELWRKSLLTNSPTEKKQKLLIQTYTNQLL